MSALASELVTIAFFVLVGWASLWPVRRRLGPLAYHGAALPAGLLSAALAGAFSTVTGRPLDLTSALAGALLLIAGLWVIQRVVLAPDGSSGGYPSDVQPGAYPVGPRSFAIAAGALGVLSVVVGVARFTVSNNDSLVSYWPLGVELSRKGAFSAGLMGSRSPLLPSMNAIHATLGSDWAYVIYPLLGATLLFWIGTTLWSGPLGLSSRKVKMLAAGGAVAFLVVEPSFIFHSFFVHSHMTSAVYLMLALACLWVAAPAGLWRDRDGSRDAYLVLAGLFTSGLALGRPDGLAYQFVVVAAAISVLTISHVRWRSVLAYFAPLLFVVGGSYAAAYVELGVWASSKLSGRTTLAILFVLVASAAAPWIVQVLDRVLPFRVAGERFFGIVATAATVLMLGVLALKWETARGALATARINLLEGAGGYHYLWWAVLLLLVLSIISGDALRLRSWTRPAFLSVVLFFVIAALVHGVSHEGRIGVGDSFNRVAFHALPLVVWYVAAVVARVMGPASPAAPSGDAQRS